MQTESTWTFINTDIHGNEKCNDKIDIHITIVWSSVVSHSYSVLHVCPPEAFALCMMALINDKQNL